MAGLLAFSVAGLGFLFLSALESPLPSLLPSSSAVSLARRLRFLSAAALSALSLLPSLVSLSSPHDPLAPALPLSSLAVSALFLLYSLSGLLSLFPSPLLDLLAFFAFGQEFLLFALRRKDLDGIENSYFDLLLVPILLCIASTALLAVRPFSAPPRLARAAGLALQGTWFLQMGFSFYTSAMAYGCQRHERSRADYTIKCKTHEEYHRARAIATLQFNCHLALLFLVGIGVYAALVRRNGSRDTEYRPLTREFQMGGLPSRFTLDSDDDDDDGEEITAESSKSKANDLTLHVPEKTNGLGETTSSG